MAERDRRAAHGARLVIVADFLDERTVDHDAVERRAAQLAERHVAGAEVVDEHAHALAAQTGAALRGRERPVDNICSVISRSSCEGSMPASRAELVTSSARLSADRYWRPTFTDTRTLRIAALGQSGEVAAGAAQHPAAELHRQSGQLGDRQEFGSGHDAANLVRPAQEGFDRDDLARREQQARLVMQFEFVVLDGLGEFLAASRGA